MALTLSVDQVDETGREILTYGTPDFPIAFFDDDLTKVCSSTHWHDELEIVIITKGIVHMRIAGNSFAMTAGEGYFANSGVVHSADLKTKAGHQHAIVFSPKIVSQAEDLIWQTCVAPILGNSRLPYIRLSPSVPWQKEFLNLVETAWNFGALISLDSDRISRLSTPEQIFLTGKDSIWYTNKNGVSAMYLPARGYSSISIFRFGNICIAALRILALLST